MSLSIFSFEKLQPRSSFFMRTRKSEQSSMHTRENEQSSVAVLDAPEEQESSHSMLLDLEHLTPEVMDAFFPSESTLPAQAPRNSSKRRNAYSR